MEMFVRVAGQFTPEECDRMRDLGDLGEFQVARIGSSEQGTVEDESIRKTDIVWMDPTKDNEWWMERLRYWAGRVNFDKFQLDLTHFDRVQYSKYKPGGHYKFHNDVICAPQDGHYRKLSFVLMLDKPDSYEGGDLILAPDGQDRVHKVRLEQGEMLFFYSFVPHSVQPVTKGLRHTMVAWMMGPKFA